MRRSILWEHLILLLASLIGIIAFLYPFFLIRGEGNLAWEEAKRIQEMPLLTILVITLCLATILAALGSGTMNSRMVAILGMLTATNAILRAIPGPAGFSAIFVLPILTGYAYGATFGFLLGSLSLLASALIGGGVGPWLPYQMLAVGWVGLSASWLPRLNRWPRVEVILLAIWAFVWGFLFGGIMNIWFWPYILPPQPGEMYWTPGLGLPEVLKRYAVFYVATSVWWDTGRAIGNGLLIFLLGRPLLTLLRRFEKRFYFVWLNASGFSQEH